MRAMGTSLARLPENGVPTANAWSTLILDCPVCRSDAAETLGVAGHDETDAAVVMSCESCATAYLTPPPRSRSDGALARRRLSPSMRQLRRWVRELPADARVVRLETRGELPNGGDIDLVVIDGVLECEREPGEFLRAAARLLSARGRILIVAGNAHSSAFAAFGGRHWIGYAASGVRQQFTALALHRLCTPCGLRVRRVSTHFSASAWFDSARSWLRDWGVGDGPSALLAGRWLVPALIAGIVESLAVLRGRGAVLVAELVRA
jgi:hypothetical protein